MDDDQDRVVIRISRRNRYAITNAGREALELPDVAHAPRGHTRAGWTLTDAGRAALDDQQ